MPKLTFYFRKKKVVERVAARIVRLGNEKMKKLWLNKGNEISLQKTKLLVMEYKFYCKKNGSTNSCKNWGQEIKKAKLYDWGNITKDLCKNSKLRVVKNMFYWEKKHCRKSGCNIKSQTMEKKRTKVRVEEWHVKRERGSSRNKALQQGELGWWRDLQNCSIKFPRSIAERSPSQSVMFTWYIH